MSKIKRWLSHSVSFGQTLTFLFTITMVRTLFTPIKGGAVRFGQTPPQLVEILLAFAQVKVGGVPGLHPSLDLELQGVGRPSGDHICSSRC